MRRLQFSLIRSEGGQTMVDLIVALALLSTSVASAGVLATSNSRINNESGRRSEATALAGREIEGLRSVRDTQERNGTAVTPGVGLFAPSAGVCKTFVMHEDFITHNWSMIDTTVQLSYSSEPTVAVFEPDPYNTSTYDNYTRLVSMCDGYDPGGQDVNGNHVMPNSVNGSTKLVKVTVQWSEGSGPKRELSYVTILTDWKH